ncbi:MAG TPA: DUF4019 domain-containing protein [Rhodothermales bacterium]
MRILLPILLVALMAAPDVVAQEVAFPDSASGAAATAWIALVDSADYVSSWDEAAPDFKANVSQQQWSQAAAQVRGALGTLQERTLARAERIAQIPGLPDGDYLLVEYVSRFAQMPRAIETHVMAFGEDATWRTIGYFVRPSQ